MPTKDGIETLDEIDWEILRLLAKDPRQPYSDIANNLNERGYQMSSEGVRYRVNKIFEIMHIFFMIQPTDQNWEVIFLLIDTISEPGVKETLKDELFSDEYWLVGSGFGTYDMYAVATAESNKDIEELLIEVKSHEYVENSEYLIETSREINVTNYFPYDV